nr:uncharacterized protein LOC113819401 [Penaeus vannamei]
MPLEDARNQTLGRPVEGTFINPSAGIKDRPFRLRGVVFAFGRVKVNMKVLAAVLFLAAAASARMAYQLSDGFLDVLGGEPQQVFSCDNRAYGYYADVANGCRIFHVCLPVTDELGGFVETAHFSFFCGNQTVFSQESLTCGHPEEAFPCDQAESLYDASNADFGKIPEQGGIDVRVA